MRKVFILFIFILFQTIVYGQMGKGISFGFAPYGHTVVRTTSGKEDIYSSDFSISNPSFHLGYEWREGYKNEITVDAFFAKEVITDTLGVAGIDATRFSVYGFSGYTLFPAKRVQIPIYIGLGLSYYNQPIPAKLFFDMGARARLKVYLTNTLAIYGEGYYIFGFTGTETSKYVANRYGIETGLLLYF